MSESTLILSLDNGARLLITSYTVLSGSVPCRSTCGTLEVLPVVTSQPRKCGTSTFVSAADDEELLPFPQLPLPPPPPPQPNRPNIYRKPATGLSGFSFDLTENAKAANAAKITGFLGSLGL